MDESKYVWINNWSSHQHKQTTAWVKLYRSILQNADFITATSNQRQTMLMSLLLADQYGRLVNNREYLTKVSMCEPFEYDFLLEIKWLTFDEQVNENGPLFLSPLSSNKGNAKWAKRESVSWKQFWEAYPRKQSKQDALKAWAQMDCDSHITAILSALKAIAPVWSEMKSKGETRFIPLAATWLRGERWTDEIETKSKDQLSPDDAEYWS